MKTTELLLSSLSITEDDYHYKGLFILSDTEKSMNVDIANMENVPKIAELKAFFCLEENTEEICKTLMEMVFAKADVGSLIKEGEDYEENAKRKKTERFANSLDLA